MPSPRFWRRQFGAFFILAVNLYASHAQATLCPSQILAEAPPTSSQRYVGVVDAISSGFLFAEALRKRGITPVHVLSTANMDPELLGSIHFEDFGPLEQFVYSGDIALLNEQTAHLDFEAILPGGETGVSLADAFSESRGLLTNGTATSAARRDKFAQIDACAKAGVPVAKQFVARSYEEVMAGIKDTGWPVVIKPRDAAAGFKVAIEHTAKGVKRAVQALLGVANPLTGKIIEEILVQEYLDGEKEYTVNGVVRDGRIYFTDVSLYKKIPFNGSPVVYESEDLVPLEEAQHLGLLDYASHVLPAVNIQHGAFHMEVKLTSKGPRLVEVGARLPGGGSPILVERSTGVSPVEIALDSYLDPQAFEARFKQERQFKAAKLVYLMTSKEGKILALPYLEQISQLPSFFRMKMNAHVGGQLVPTTNFIDYPGQIELVSEDSLQLEADYRLIRELEKRPDFYVVQPTKPTTLWSKLYHWAFSLGR